MTLSYQDINGDTVDLLNPFDKTDSLLGKDGKCLLNPKNCCFPVLYCCACSAYWNRNVVKYVGLKKEKRVYIQNQRSHS